MTLKLILQLVAPMLGQFVDMVAVPAANKSLERLVAKIEDPDQKKIVSDLLVGFEAAMKAEVDLEMKKLESVIA